MKMESQVDDWNRVNIAAPPFTTLLYSWNEDSEVLRNYLPIWKESFSCLNTFYNKGQYSNFFNECSILNGLTLFHKRHRKEKFYNLLLKIRKCVGRLKKGQIFRTVSKILQMVPVYENREGNVRLPTRQLFEYLLIRIFGIFQLLLTIDDLCLAVGKILIGNLKRGYDYKAALAFLPAVARLRVLTLYYAQHLAYLYDEVFPTLQYLKGRPRFSLSQSSSLSQELIDHCQYEKDEDTRSVTSQKIESGVLDIFVESKEMPLEVSDILSRFGEKFGFKVCSDDDKDDSSSDETHDTNYLKNVSGFTPKVEVSKKVMGLSEPQTKKELKLSEKEKDLISLLDILNDNLDENTTGSTLNSHEYNEKSESKTKSSLHVDSLMRSEDLGEIIDSNKTGNKKKKDKQKKRKISECEVSGKNAVEEKG
ncbi:uncharacterized protein LOC135224881 [Macrobrachium nipponense]|uniref:uncharacterized protein LOC135224881 n=1 Tax=Macrobrachium nipponense TaxID=159736 RepID=UPI0030C8A8D7